MTACSMATSWIAASWMAVLLTLNKSKTFEQNSHGRNRMPVLFCSFFDCCLMLPAPYPDFSDLWTSPPALSSTLTLGFFECLGIQFFNLLTYYLLETMPHQGSPTLIPREAEDFTRGDNHSKHVPLLIYLA